MKEKGEEIKVDVEEDDLVFITNGSMTASSTLGSMHAAATLTTEPEDPSWALWEKIAVDHPEFGRPSVFSKRVNESKWMSFTTTLRDPLFFDLMEKFTGNAAGTGALVTLTDSNWLMSVVLAYQPHYIDQPESVQVFWGYGLYMDRPGNFVKKKMVDCSGEEIMTELCTHLRFTTHLPKIISTSNCIPCVMPYITSQFLTRAKGDRPEVIPQGWTNLAFVSQFCEIPDDVVFTVEYSVRAAQTAVFKLLDLDKEVSPIYRGDRDIRVLMEALMSIIRKDKNLPDLPEHPLQP
jgi:oleate hydratase